MKRFCIFLAAAVSVFNVSAGVRMPRFFSDNTVLQRDMPVRVWGRASAGDTVEVRLGGTAAAAVADSSGRWLAELPPMQPGGPFEMSVEGPDSTIVFGNVMIGDVWLCSGQSNMEWPLDMTEGSAEEIAASSCPAIRLLTVGRNCTPDEQEEGCLSALWTVPGEERTSSRGQAGIQCGQPDVTESCRTVRTRGRPWGRAS